MAASKLTRGEYQRQLVRVKCSTVALMLDTLNNIGFRLTREQREALSDRELAYYEDLRTRLHKDGLRILKFGQHVSPDAHTD